MLKANSITESQAKPAVMAAGGSTLEEKAEAGG